ncbi:MAG TPA: phosphoglycerate dehydrogenase, partial [Vampirovibrionales bacterium]
APADASMKSGKWQRKKFLGIELRKKVLGVIGLGKIGSKVARVAQSLGMEILAFDPVVTEDKAKSLNIKLVDLEEIWAKSDFITLHVPKIPQTVNLINKNTISKMKHEVRIVNCARGGIVNEADIAEALTNGRIAGAALDVFDAEPISEDSPLLKLDPETAKKVVLTPHLGASTEEAQLNVAIDVAEQIRDVLNGKFARSAVNLPGFRGLDVEEIKSHLNLCVMLGKFMDQYSSGRINELNIRFRGKLSERKDLNPLALAVTKGFLSNKLENVSFVNANKLAKEKGIKVLETRSSGNCDYSEEVELKIKSDQGEFQVVGTLQSGQLPIITKLNEYSFFVPPSEHMLLTLHHDRPGVIAKISAILGKEEINISGMALSRKTERSEALMICNLDQAISENALKQIKELSEIEKSAYISL